MTTAILILTLAAASALVGLVYAALVKNDGYSRPDRASSAPRSHVPDLFDPRSPQRFA